MNHAVAEAMDVTNVWRSQYFRLIMAFFNLLSTRNFNNYFHLTLSHTPSIWQNY